jgi:ferredoxin-NADP reductase
MNYVVQAEIIGKKMIQPDVVELLVKPEKIRNYTPGSFAQLSLETATASERWPESRTFSIASYSKEYIRFIIKEQGEYTKRIVKDSKIGQLITIKYPFGEMFNRKNADSRHIFIAGGLGITPFLSMIDYFKENGLNNYFLFYSVKFKHQFIDLDQLKNKTKNLYLFTTKEDSEYISRRINIDDIQKLRLCSTDHFYICGSKDFIMYFRDSIVKLGFTNIHMDEWE